MRLLKYALASKIADSLMEALSIDMSGDQRDLVAESRTDLSYELLQSRLLDALLYFDFSFASCKVLLIKISTILITLLTFFFANRSISLFFFNYR